MTLKSYIWVILGVVAQLLVVTTVWAEPQVNQASYEVVAIDVDESGSVFLVNIKGKKPPTYTVYELFDPLRVVLDIADATFGKDVILPLPYNRGPISQITGNILQEKEPSIAKVEILLSKDWPYSAKREGNNIQIAFSAPKGPAKKVVVASDIQVIAPKSKKKVVSKVVELETSIGPASIEPQNMVQNDDLSNDPVTDLLESISAPALAEDDILVQNETGSVASDKFLAAGYKKKKISVDFYKIDLHNVFRLFGEISGANMIIDEGVAGTLTLALNEVPWDFAMDIILNLKGLQKEERFNTIVISPSSKKFSWPTEPEKSLEIAVPQSDIKIAIEQRLEMPKGMLEAKKIMRRARKIEQDGNNKRALELYEQAFLKWSDNGSLARQIASFCLVKMGMNAKALHYAKAALRLDAKDYQAALQAAVASANMQKVEAGNYFKLAISKKIPSQEALVSYAAYAEQSEDFSEALQSLQRLAEIYGDSLESMIARARIYDRNGQKDMATAEYRSLLFSGYALNNDLKRYIKGRVALDN